MLKSGYTKKLIEQFGTSLEEIINLELENKPQEALEIIHTTFSNLFRLNSMFFDSVSVENLLDILKVNGVIERDKTIVIAKLLEEEAKIYEKSGKDNESTYIYIKSLALFLEAFLCDRDAELTDQLKDINFVFNKVSSYKLPDSVLANLISYFEEKGLYDSAENAIYDLLDNTCNSESSIETGIEFYKKLLTKSDENLENGNLPRNEITEGIKRLSMLQRENIDS